MYIIFFSTIIDISRELINSLATKLKKRLTGLEKLKYVMNKNIKRNIVEGVFNSVLCYCLPLFGGCDEADI